MPATVKLTVIAGPTPEAEFEFAEKAHCVAGRSEDCSPHIDEPGPRFLVSRHHCLFDINPPAIRIRDFGSLNGTHVNGEEIGRRRKGQTPEQGAVLEFRERDLADGDEVRLGDTVLRISVTAPATCPGCGSEVETDNAVCTRCRLTQFNPASATPQCATCGTTLPDPLGGQQICLSCRRQPQQLVRGILRNADAGQQGLSAIQGYELVRELGRGGNGVVHLVQHQPSGRYRALKVLLADVRVQPQAERDFLREMETLRGLDHPNIVAFLEGGSSGASFYFVCEYCDGGSLDQLVQRDHPLEMADAVGIAVQMLTALDYAHTVPVESADGATTAVGLVHRDVKPANILLTGSRDEPVAKLADFGLAKAFERAGLSGHTMTGSAAGTVGFMSRPQLINYKFVKPEVDVWAAAATLYFMLTKRTPREFPRGVDPLAVVLRDNAIPIRQRNPSIPRRLAEVIDEALIDNPKITITTAAELRRALLETL